MRWLLVVAFVLLACAAVYGAYIENTASMTYPDPYTGAEVTVYSNAVQTDILEPHTVTIQATAVPIP